MFAYIPARIGSKRVPKKNIKMLDGKPVICHVIEHLLQIKQLKGIAVSTDSGEIRQIVERYPQVTCLNLREPDISGDQASFMDLVKQDLPRFCQHFQTEQVLFCLATAALIQASYYQQAIAKFDGTGLVMSVEQLPTSAHLALQTNEQEQLVPLFPEKYLLPTAELKPLYADAGGFYLFNTREAAQHEMLISLAPIRFICLPENIAIDVDTSEDWYRLEQNYKKLKQKG